jgi:hypothetical protein
VGGRIMANGITIEDLLKAYDCDSVAELSGYITYLEEVKADYEYMKTKFKSLAAEIDNLY